jgi:hypothetical protein
MQDSASSSKAHVDAVHRVSAAGLGSSLSIVGLFRLLHRQEGIGELQPPLGSAALLSTMALVAGGILVAAAARGGRAASTASVVIGTAFLLVGLVTVMVLGTGLSPLAFGVPDVILCLTSGGLLLFVGAYGRFTGGLPADNYYRQQRRSRVGGAPVAVVHRGPIDVTAVRELAAAERAVTLRVASPQQAAAVTALRGVPTDDRVDAWRAATSTHA